MVTSALLTLFAEILASEKCPKITCFFLFFRPLGVVSKFLLAWFPILSMGTCLPNFSSLRGREVRFFPDPSGFSLYSLGVPAGARGRRGRWLLEVSRWSQDQHGGAKPTRSCTLETIHTIYICKSVGKYIRLDSLPIYCRTLLKSTTIFYLYILL